MAKETRQILNGVRVGNKVYTEDGVFVGGAIQADEDPHDGLAKALDAKQLERLTKKGHIAGFVKEEKPKKEEK